MTGYFASHAWLPEGVVQDVTIEVASGVITEVRPGSVPRPGAVRLPGVVLPGLANAHSHAFHRALRGRTHAGGGTFWTWREQMYAVAARLDPDSYRQLATAVYAEMALAGVTCVGEFHYVHHAPDGRPYAEPDAMDLALQEAAAEAGIRITLLDTCYLTSAPGAELLPEQRRFGDGSADAWAERATGRRVAGDHVRLGVAAHSVRAVPADALPTVVAAAEALGPLAPVHAHLSEQPAENHACRAAYGVTPTQLLADHGVLGPRTSLVHATHLDRDDVAIIGAARAYACFCPTTERDLADGIGPARALAEGGARLTLGSDQHAIIDLLEEARALELHERLQSLERGRFAPSDLVRALTADGHASLGWPDAGAITVGSRADLVAVRLDTVRTAGADPAQVVMAASAADVDTVVVDGTVVVSGGQHHLGDDVGSLLSAAVARVAPAPRAAPPRDASAPPVSG